MCDWLLSVVQDLLTSFLIDTIDDLEQVAALDLARVTYSPRGPLHQAQYAFSTTWSLSLLWPHNERTN